MSKLKNSIKKLTAWSIMISLLIGSCYWTDANVSAKEKGVNFKDFITTTAWNYNGAGIGSDTTCQVKPDDTITASYEYEIPAGTVAAGAKIKLPIFDAFAGTLVSSSSDKADVRIDGQMITIALSKTGLDTTVESPSAVSLSGPAVDLNTETVSGIIVIEYRLHTGILGEEPFLEMTLGEINIQSPNMLNLKAVPEFLTGVKLYIGDKELELGTTPVERSSMLEVSYEFACDKGENLKNFEVNLPTEFKNTNYPRTELKQDGIVLCEASVDNSIIKFEFNDNIKDKEDIIGRFRFSTQFNKLVIGKSTSKDIKFELGAKSETVTVNFIPPNIDPKYSPSSGEIIDIVVGGAPQKAIKWTQKIKVGTNVKDKATLTDTWKHATLLYQTQTYVSGSMKITSDDIAVPVAFTPPESVTDGIHTDGNGITYSIDNMGSFMNDETIITITYETVINPKIYSENTTTLDSTGKLSTDTLTIKGSSETVRIKPQRISKFYTLDLPKKKVNWTYVINESTINMYNAVLTAGIDKDKEDKDVEFAYQTLDKTQGVRIKVGIAEERTLDPSEYTLTAGDKGFTYEFKSNATESTNPLNQVTEIKFTTDISEEFFKTNQSDYEFKTNAKLKWYYTNTPGDGSKEDVGEWKDGADKPMGGNTIVAKEGIGYDASKGIITWKIKVTPNDNGIELKGVKLIDTIPSPQKYISNSVKVTGITGETVTETQVDGDDVITIDLGEIGKNSVTVELQTKVPDSVIYDNINIKDIDKDTEGNAEENEKVEQTNRLKMTATDGIIGGIINVAPANCEIESRLLRKKSVYSKENHTIDWTIYINESKLPIKKAKIVDILPPEVSYVADSFSIEKTSSPGSSVGTFPGITDHTFIYDFVEDTTLIDGTIEDSYTIKYQTKITDFTIFEKNQKYDNIKNIVRLTGKSAYDTPEVSVDIQSKKKQPVEVSLAQKAVVNELASGKVVDSFIKWRITVNQDRMELKNATISDDLLALAGGLELDSSDMKLVKGEFGSDGDWKKDAKGNWIGTEIPIEIEDFTYDITTKQFVFKIPDSKNSAYQLFFTTKITDKTNRRFTVNNTAKFYNEFVAGGVKSQDAECSINISMPDGDISSSGNVGNVTIKEKENNTDGKVLPGTEFALFNKYGQVGKSQITGSDGKVKFEDLTYNVDYTIKEIKPTAGYRDKTSDIPVKATSSNKKIEVESYSEVLKAEISFKKVAETEDGNVLAGAEFALYTKENTPVKVTTATSTADLDSNGYNITFSNIPYGNYQIKEETVPVGYKISSTPIEVVMSQDTKENGYGIKLEVRTPFDNRVFVNMTESGDISVKLVTKEDPNVALAKGKFEIYDNNEMLVGTKETDANGELVFTELYIKKYTIKQISAPDKYIKSEKAIPVTLELTDRSKSVVVENPIIAAPLKVNVKSALRGRVVPGAKFAIYYKTDTNFINPIIKDVESDKQGNVDFGIMSYGEYIIRQEGTPEGFIESSFLIDASIVDVEEVIIPAINQEITGTVTITITDKVAGVEYTLYDEEGNILAVSKTDKDGILVFDNVVYGNHKMKQTDVPSGYESSNKEYDITIKEQNDEEDIVIDSIPKTPQSGGENNFVGFPPVEEKPEEVLPEEKEEIQDDKGDEKPKKKPNKKPSKPSQDNNPKNDKTDNSNNNSGSGNHNDKPSADDPNNSTNSSGSKDKTNSGANSTIGETTNNSGKAGAVLPQAGAFFDFKLLTTLGISLILIGTASKFKRKKVR